MEGRLSEGILPTGYTHAVVEGEGITFRQYMLCCVRAMGVCIEMREDPLDAPPPKPSENDSSVTYHEQALTKARDRLKIAEALTIEQCDREAELIFQASLVSYNERRNRSLRDKARYEAMLAQAERWEPPTPDHENFKKFMVDQIKDSLKFDCGWLTDDCPWSIPPVRKTAEDWRAGEIEEQRRRVTYHEEQLKKAKANLAEKNAWLEAFWDSLPVPEPFDQITYVVKDAEGNFDAFSEAGGFITKVPAETAKRWPEQVR